MSDLTGNNDLTGYEIAVIGMAGRFPGAGSIAEFWENLKKGKENICFFSTEELVESGINAEMIEHPGYVKAKAPLEDVDYFDASFFNYTLREAEIMDPQLRILHQCSWNALEDAGYNPDTFDGLIGFYAGANTHFSWLAAVMNRIKDQSDAFGAVSLNDGYSISTQVSYRLNLKGPALTIQTACSTSLVAIHTACQALLSGECHMALAGGVSVKLPNKNGYTYQEGMVLSPDGHCRTFDAKAAGCFEGNGAGVVVLKPLENALDNGDHIYAVVKGTAINNDGNRRVGFSAPSVLGQAEVIRTALKAAEVEPGSISYIEAHGTATTLGDPVEIRALTRAFNTKEKQFCRIGSVKSNIGHLDAAAGAAGFIKTVLALHHRMIPPSLHFETPNPEIDFQNSPFIVNTTLTGWKNNNGSPPRAGVSSFGIGGTNAHAVLEAWGGDSGPVRRRHRLILLSGRTEGALERNTENLAEFLKKNPGMNFADAVYTLQVGRKGFEYRRTMVCRDAEEAVELLSANNSKKVHTHRVIGENPPVIFMFSGLGSQYVNMGYGLYNDEPIFREEMDRCFEILKPLLDYDIKAVLYPGEEAAKNTKGREGKRDIHGPDVSQLVVFIFEYALAKLLTKWGITPHAMIGYSFGEYTAACVSGVFTLGDALKLIVHRGRLINKTPAGAMLSVPLSREELLPLLPAAGETGELSLAIDNGPSCIVAGLQEAVALLEKQLKQKKYLCMRLNTAQAIHSTLMNSILTEFEEKVKEIPLKEPQIPYISNVTGKWIGSKEAADPGYWARHLAGTVRFAEGIDELVKEPRAIFLELGPGRDLSTSIQRSLGKDHRVINLVRPEQKEISDSAYLPDRLGLLWLYGKTIDWRKLYDGRSEGKERRRVSLPGYSFEARRFVLETGVRPVQPGLSQAAPQPVEYKYERTQLPGDYEAPRDKMEEKIAEAFQSIFGLDQISIHDDFFELGGDSLKVIALVTGIHRQTDLEIPMEAVFKNPTVKELAGYAGKKAVKSIFAAIPPVEKKEYYPQSPSQKRVFIMEMIEERGMAYNQPTVTWMKGPLDIPLLENVYKGLMERHESLRTGFFIKDGEPVQKVYAAAEIQFQFEYFDLTAKGTDGTGNTGETEGKDIENILGNFVQPFDLSHPPLWQVGLINLPGDKHLLMDMIHHIVSDDISVGILMTELSALYSSGSFGPMRVQYKDFVVWRGDAAPVDGGLEEQKQSWMDLFSDAPNLPVLDMPYDYPRPAVQCFDGAHTGFLIDGEQKEKLLALAGKNKTTLFVLLFTFYNTLLYTYTGQEDIIVGVPITGRSHRDVQEVVGMFVNTLALRNYPKGNKTFEEFLREVKENSLRAFSNQSYQFEDLVEQLDLPRDTSRNPLFDTMFVLHTVNLEKIQLPGVRLDPYTFEHPACRFDITLSAAEFSRGLTVGLEYSTALFKKETMERFLEHLKAVVNRVLENPRLTLDEIAAVYPEAQKRLASKGIGYDILKYLTSENHKNKVAEESLTAGNGGKAKEDYELDISGVTAAEEFVIAAAYNKNRYANKTIDTLLGHYKKEFHRIVSPASKGFTLTEEDRKRILYEFNNTLADYPAEKTLKELFEDRAAKAPGNIAVIGGAQSAVERPGRNIAITYNLLNEKSNRLAHRLRDRGVGAGTVIALLTGRTVEMLIGLFAVLKAGAAYLPLGPEYPRERVRYMLGHTEAPVILTTEPELPFEHSARIIDLTRQDDEDTHRSMNLPGSGTSADPAYVIYTSGTTGIPKGVVIENRSVHNFIKGITDIIPFTGSDSILSLTTLAFDIFGLETLLPLVKGSTVVIGGVEEQLDAAAAGAVIEREKINIMQVTPSRLKLFISDSGAGAGLARLQYLLVGGEAFPMALLEKTRPLTRGKIYNLYGPTETTIWSSIKDVTGQNPLNIGKPLANTRIYIVGEDGQMQPTGTAGELCISGHGTARGYFKDETLTREKFIPNPFIHDDDPDGERNSRLYRTGDLARWLPDGNIEFMGRIDHQVKIRGFRIEPEEIEHRLTGHEAIKEAVVIPREENNDKFLWAYIVPEAEKELNVSRLREYLAVDLPEHMIPSYFVKIEKIPLTLNGKIDRKALANVEGTLLKTGSKYVPPETDLEKNIVDTWKEMLNLEEVGIEDNFFDLGGTSLKLIMTVGRLKQALNRDIPVVTMFRYPTVRLMANFLSHEPIIPKKRDRSDIKKKGRERLSRKRDLRQ